MKGTPHVGIGRQYYCLWLVERWADDLEPGGRAPDGHPCLKRRSWGSPLSKVEGLYVQSLSSVGYHLDAKVRRTEVLPPF
jgi:hypothetical protein